MANSNPNIIGLNPQAARKGDLKQGTIQLTAEEWDYLDSLVQAAKDSSLTTLTKRIGRADIIRGLLLACKVQSEGLSAPLPQVAIGELDDEEGDCLACGGAEYHLKLGPDHDCPLCDGKGTHLLGACDDTQASE